MDNRAAAGGYLEWERVKEFEEGGVVVTLLIMRIERPKYNLEIGFRTQQQQKVVRRLPLAVSGQGQLILKRTDTEILARLIRAAEDLGFAECQKAENERVGRQVEQTVRAASRDLQRGPAGARGPMGIKTLGKLDKARREAMDAGGGTKKG